MLNSIYLVALFFMYVVEMEFTKIKKNKKNLFLRTRKSIAID